MAEEQSNQETKPLTREEWRQRLAEEGREETIKKEMIRLGFWKDKPLSPEEKRQAAIEEAEIERLEKELTELRQESNKLNNVKELLKKARKKRIEESKRKRAERKALLEKQRAEAKDRRKAYRESHIVHAGQGVSAGLQTWTIDEERLKQWDLPLLRSAMELSEAIGLSLSQLKWLTYHRDTATLCHYYRFTIPKKMEASGNYRLPSPPYVRRSLG